MSTDQDDARVKDPSRPSLSADQVPDWIVFDEIGGLAPVQAEGHVVEPDARFYFRARGQYWSISISADPSIDPVAVNATAGACHYHEEEYGQTPFEASYMSLDVARFFIVRQLTAWRESALSSSR